VSALLWVRFGSHALVEACRVEDWEQLRKWLCNPADPTFASPFANRFVRINVDV
jgi:hypothetical protein